MSTDKENMLSFSCQHCGKKLKAPAKAKGKRVKCPKCQEKVTIPSSSSRTTSATKAKQLPKPAVSKPAEDPIPSSEPPKRKTSLLEMEDPFSLDMPAIDDLEGRKKSTDEFKEAKEKERALRRMKQENRKRETEERKKLEKEVADGAVQPIQGSAVLTDDGLIPFDSVDEESAAKQEDATAKPQPKSEAKQDNSINDATSEPDGGLFEGDLNLEELQAQADSSPNQPINASAQKRSAPKKKKVDQLEDLGDLVPELDGAPNRGDLPALSDEELMEEAEYRIVCSTCGTAQYVSPSAKGMKIKCPDCFALFTVPPPPPGWKPKKKKKLAKSASIGDALDDELGLAAPEQVADTSNEQRKEHTEELLEKARGQLSEEEEERLYDSDFDHATFVQKTFGFLKDPLIFAQVAAYGLVFFGLFWLMQYGYNDTDSQYGRGVLLLTVVLVPLVAILFALPMLSGGLSLIESVANKQRFVKELPAFNIFDNAADLIVIAVSFFASIVPGFMLGLMVSGEESKLMFELCGMVFSGFLLFPILLLSMLDNGSVFAPVSSSVIRSITEVAEGWGGYYMKTFVASCLVVLMCLMLIGGSPILAGFVGLMLPLLVFFTCQQIGSLANDIGDHLSFEFTSSDGEDEDADPTARGTREVLDLDEDQ